VADIDLEADLDVFFSSDLTTTAIYNGVEYGVKSVLVQFERPTDVVDLVTGSAMDSNPQAMAKKSDLPNVKAGHTLRISGRTYRIDRVDKDDTELVLTMKLSEIEENS